MSFRNKVIGRLNLSSSAPDYSNKSKLDEEIQSDEEVAVQSQTVGTYYFRSPLSPLYNDALVEEIPPLPEIEVITENPPSITVTNNAEVTSSPKKINERRRLSSSSPVLFQHSKTDGNDKKIDAQAEKVVIEEKKETVKKKRYSQEMLFAMDDFSGEDRSKEEKIKNKKENDSSDEEQFQFSM